ncbi:hypothetical protein HHI36_002647, partial [Cryptolaemus montrouzieri]
MQIYRNESFKCRASETTIKDGIDPNFKENRQRKNVLDAIIAQVNARFTGMSSISQIFDFPKPSFLLEVDKTTSLQKCGQFQ